MNSTESKDQKGFAFLRNEIVHTGVTPSLRTIARAVGYSSPRSVQLMLERLQKKGLISYTDGVITLHNTGALNRGESTVNVPLIGAAACGLPMLAEEDYEALIPVSTRLARPGKTYFLLRAKGTSMNRSGIDDRDLVLVRRQPDAEEGEKVVALIDNDATIKHFHRAGDVVVLKPNSTEAKHKPIVLSKDFLIQGVVVATMPADVY